MSDMPDVPPDFASLGRRLKQRLLLALCLSSGLPLLVLAYVVHRYIVPEVTSLSAVSVAALEGLVFFTALAMVGGAWLIWDLGRTVGRVALLLAAQPTLVGKLKETSFRDEVTGLYNRRFFSLRLEEEMSRFRRFNHPVSVVVLDIDGFKNVNDEFGHAVGDETLRDLGQILMKHSRGINVVARFGGDEFTILLVETPKAGAQLYAERIRQVVATFPFSHGKQVTASFGVASLPDDEVASSDDLFRAADEALYAAKRAGKNQVVAAKPRQQVGG